MFKYKKQISTNNLNREFEFLSQEITKLKLPGGFTQFVLYALSELFANVKEHSEALKCFISLSIGGTDLSLEVTDSGIGLRKSYLKKRIFPKDDFSAVEFTLAGLSTKDPYQRGFGIYTLKKLTSALGGIMVIKTADVSVKIVENKIERTSIKQQKGVSIILETPIKDVEFYKHIE